MIGIFVLSVDPLSEDVGVSGGARRLLGAAGKSDTAIRLTEVFSLRDGAPQPQLILAASTAIITTDRDAVIATPAFGKLAPFLFSIQAIKTHGSFARPSESYRPCLQRHCLGDRQKPERQAGQKKQKPVLTDSVRCEKAGTTDKWK